VFHLTFWCTLCLIFLRKVTERNISFYLGCAICDKQDIHVSFLHMCSWFFKQKKVTEFPRVFSPRGAFCVCNVFFNAVFGRTDLMEGLSPWEESPFPPPPRPGFDPRSGHVGFAVGRVVLGQVSLSTSGFPVNSCSTISFIFINYSMINTVWSQYWQLRLIRSIKEYPLSSLFSGFLMEKKMGNEISLDWNPFM
jgi:hypothetical protein